MKKDKKVVDNALATTASVPTPVAEAPKVETPKQGVYRVFSARMELVAQVTDEAEARSLAGTFNGSYKKI